MHAPTHLTTIFFLKKIYIEKSKKLIMEKNNSETIIIIDISNKAERHGNQVV